jgi:hypothetical protein
MPSVGWTETTSKQFQDYIVGFLKVTPSLYRMLNNNGLVRNLGDGISKFNYLEAKEVDGGKMASSIHQHNIVVPQWGEVDVSVLYLNTLIRLSRQEVDKHRNIKGRLRGNLVQDTINMVIPTMLNQVDQFCAWGDRMKDSLTALDKYRNTDTFTGLFNSGTLLEGGGGDDIMTTLGDFKTTVGNMRKAMRSAAHEMNQYMVLSDLETANVADNNPTHEYTTVGISEMQRILEKKYVKKWMDSANFIDSSGEKYRMAMIAPKQVNPAPIGGKGISNNFELVQGYPFKVMPVYGGDMDIDGYYNWKVTWSGAFVVYKETAIQHTGDLTLT